MATIRDTPLVGSAEAARLLEIGPTNFSHLRKKMEDAGDDSFPAPITKLQCGPIWLESDMVKFKKHYDARRRRVRSNGDAAAPAAKAAPAKPTKTVAKNAAAKPRAKSAGKATATATVTNIKPSKKLALAGKAG